MQKESLAMRIKHMLSSALALAMCVLLSQATSASEKPNLLIIHTDEQSFRTLSCHRGLVSQEEGYVWGEGVGVHTPHIDSISHQGAIALSYYAATPVCVPSRASLLTGLRPHATGAWKNGQSLRNDVPTFASILAEKGYATAYVGKWHLAGNEPKYTFNVEYTGGFKDSRFMMSGGHAPYFQITPDGSLKSLGAKQGENAQADEVVHLTDYFIDRSLEVLDDIKGGPFCIMISIPDPHTPDYARPPYGSMYDHLSPQPPVTMAPEHVKSKPSWAKGGKNEAKEFNPDALRQYFGMVKHIDDGVGRLLAYLDDNNLTQNTIVVFTSDHGDMFYEHNRTNKGVPYEGSAKIPFVIRYPGHIPAGKVIRKAYTTADFAPTILSMMGVQHTHSFHGEDTAADYLGVDLNITDDRMTYFTSTSGWWVAAITQRYKLVIDKREKPYLFDLHVDPYELVNQFNNPNYGDVVTRLKSGLLEQLEKDREPGLVSSKRPYILE